MIGELTQHATLQAKTLTPDGGGGYDESWETFGMAWIALAPISGGDVFGPDTVESRIRHRITLRRRSDLAAGQRALVGSRKFKIHAVLDDGPQSKTVTLMCEEMP